MARNTEKIEKLKFLKNNFTWIAINHPEEKELDYLQRTYKFHHLDLEDILSENQRPKIDEYVDYLFIVLQLPIKTSRKKHIETDEIDIFIGQNFVVTIHYNNPIIKKLFSECQKKPSIKEEFMSKGSGYFLYKIVDELFESNFPMIDDIGRQINEMEKEVFDPEHSRDRLKDILILKKDIINFRRIIMPERGIIAQLEHKNKKFIPEDLDVYFDDIVDKIEKIWNNLENLQELVLSIQETNESIISHNTNNIIRILTVFSVIMLPMTVITGFYGMNVDLPLAEKNNTVLMILGLMTAIGTGMIAYFRYKRWL